MACEWAEGTQPWRTFPGRASSPLASRPGAMSRLSDNSRTAAITIIGVLVWCLIVVGIALLLGPYHSNGAMALLFIVGVPLLPGASVCAVVDSHSSACVPGAVIGNLVFYLAIVFVIKKRRSQKEAETMEE